jgi:hypothetical protein
MFSGCRMSIGSAFCMELMAFFPSAAACAFMASMTGFCGISGDERHLLLRGDCPPSVLDEFCA